jgi:hypothetical protein
MRSATNAPVACPATRSATTLDTPQLRETLSLGYVTVSTEVFFSLQKRYYLWRYWQAGGKWLLMSKLVVYVSCHCVINSYRMTGFRHDSCYTFSCPFDFAQSFDAHRHIKLVYDNTFVLKGEKPKIYKTIQWNTYQSYVRSLTVILQYPVLSSAVISQRWALLLHWKSSVSVAPGKDFAISACRWSG